MKICVLQPSYDKSELLKGYAAYDPPRNLSSLVPQWSVTHLFLHKANAYAQIKEAKKQGYDLFVNLCEGHLDWDVPSIDVIHALDSLGLVYTGPTAEQYEPRKDTLKLVARYAGLRTPEHVTAASLAEVDTAAVRLRFPLFVKPNEGGDSWGIDEASHCTDAFALRAKAAALLEVYDRVLIEEFVDGREFSVLVASDATNQDGARVFRPIEFCFPPGERFKTYDLKNAQYHPNQNVAVAEPALETTLMAAARQFFLSYPGSSYCRLDFRLDAEGVPNFLDANFTCSVFYPEGYYGTADYILRNDGFGTAAFLRLIVDDSMERHRRRQRPYAVQATSAGLGIVANRPIFRGEIVFKGEERSQRIATRRWVETTWDTAARRVFSQYAYPLSDEVYILWSERPQDWAPQNHSCAPTTRYDGLNVVALCDLAIGDELTLDYAELGNEHAEAFECLCGAPRCRGLVTGVAGNSVDRREKSTGSSA